LDAGAQPDVEQLEALKPADLVVGILDAGHVDPTAAVASVREAIGGMANPPRAVVVCDTAVRVPGSPAASPDGSPPVVYSNLTSVVPGEVPQASQALLAVSRRLEARACGLVATQLGAVTSQWIQGLVQPVLELGFDLVAPRYTRHNLEGLLNRSILSPLYRALYGEQLQNPLGPDFGLSSKLMEDLVAHHSVSRRAGVNEPLASVASTAATNGFQICESNLGARSQPSTDWTNLSGLLAAVLGPVFLDVEHKAAIWQRVRGSRPVPAFGRMPAAESDGATVDTRRLIESFHLGSQNLQDVWGLVMPPTTLLELKKLARQPAEKFRMPDNLWACIVYDFALGHRLRTISRDHLLRSMTPLYLGWIASYALEIENAPPPEIEARGERLAQAYESAKSYMVSRWRWPDRFIP
jgi:hypothetical protein